MIVHEVACHEVAALPKRSESRLSFMSRHIHPDAARLRGVHSERSGIHASFVGTAKKPFDVLAAGFYSRTSRGAETGLERTVEGTRFGA